MDLNNGLGQRAATILNSKKNTSECGIATFSLS